MVPLFQVFCNVMWQNLLTPSTNTACLLCELWTGVLLQDNIVLKFKSWKIKSKCIYIFELHIMQCIIWSWIEGCPHSITQSLSPRPTKYKQLNFNFRYYVSSVTVLLKLHHTVGRGRRRLINIHVRLLAFFSIH